MTHRITLARGVKTARRTPAISQPREPKSWSQLPTLRWRNGAHGVLATGLVLCLALAGALPVAAQELDWAKRAGGTESDLGQAIATDGAGNSYVTGVFLGTATFGAGEGNETVLTGIYDLYLSKYDPDGALVWARHAGGPNVLDSRVAADNAGNSYVTGFFSGTTTFGIGADNETVLTEAGSGGGDIFVAKYDSSGVLAWAKAVADPGQGVGAGITIDHAGNSYVTGRFQGAATFAPGEANETALTAAGNYDIFIAKYDPSGALIWATSAGSNSHDEGGGIKTDGAGNSYVIGGFQDAATFGAGEVNETTLTAGENGDIFVAKYDSSGRLVWARRAGGTGFAFSRESRSTALATPTSAGTSMAH